MIRRLSLKVSILAMILIASCGDEQSGSSFSEQDQIDVLTNVGRNIIVPSYKTLRTKVGVLPANMESFKADLSVDNLNTLRASLKAKLP